MFVRILLSLVAVAVAWVMVTSIQPAMKKLAREDHPEIFKREKFEAIREANPKHVHEVLPESVGKPLVVEFHSKLCGDCKRMAPHVAAVFARYPQVVTKIYDIQDDRKKFMEVFQVFNPLTVPILVFLRPDGTTMDVLYDYHPEAEIDAKMKELLAVKPQAVAKAKAP
jgi:thiol:disulfide interchange protein